MYEKQVLKIKKKPGNFHDKHRPITQVFSRLQEITMDETKETS
jgi:hypothetical protein